MYQNLKGTYQSAIVIIMEWERRVYSMCVCSPYIRCKYFWSQESISALSTFLIQDKRMLLP